MVKKPAVPSHPPYADMIREAIVTLKERSGSSLPAIKKYVAGRHKLPEGWEKKMSLYLKKMTADGKLVKVKGSWKLGEGMKTHATKPKKLAVKKSAGKPAVAKKPKKPKAKKPKTGGVAKPVAAKPKAAPKPKVKAHIKKAAPKKAAPKKVVKKPAPKKSAPKKK